MGKAQVSVVIVSYNTGAVLGRCLDTVLQQEGLREVIVVNHGNPPEVDAYLQQLQAQEARCTVLAGQGNIGFAAGCNLGARHAQGEYILLLNPDCLLPPDALTRAMAALQSHPHAWMAGCQLINPDGTPQGGSKRNLLTPSVAFSQAFRLHQWPAFPTLNIPEAPSDSEPYEVPAISGAFMMLHRDHYARLGGLDEAYFFHVEDLDLCWQIQHHGGKILYVPAIKAVHYRSSSNVSSLFIERNKTKGFLRYFRKYYTVRQQMYLYPLMVVAIYLRLWLRAPFLVLRRWLTAGKRRAIHDREHRQIQWLRQPVEDSMNLELQPYEPVIVAGSTGQVGLSIVRRLLAEDITTYALYHQQIIDYHHPKLQWVQGDVQSGFMKMAGHIRAKTLVHTPAIWYLPDRIENFAAMGVKRIICFSSTSIEGKAASSNSYEKKLVERFIHAEQMVMVRCKEYGMDCTILRPTMIYGIGLDRNISSIMRFIRKTGFFPVTTPGTGLRQPVHTDDLAKAVLQVMPRRATFGKTYNLSGAEQISYKAMVRRIFTALGKKDRTIALRSLPLMMDMYSCLSGNKDTNGEIAKRMNYDLVFDHYAAQQDFGYTPREFVVEIV